MRLEVNRKTCLKSGQCTYLHPELFREGEDGYPVVLVGSVNGELLTAAEDAAELCPSRAIELHADGRAANP